MSYELLFESQKDRLTVSQGGTEINGLSENSVPENCEIIDKFVKQSEHTGEQTHYLVRFCKEELIHLRVCDAHDGSGYDEFAVLLFIGIGEEDEEHVTERFSTMKEASFVDSAIKLASLLTPVSHEDQPSQTEINNLKVLRDFLFKNREELDFDMKLWYSTIDEEFGDLVDGQLTEQMLNKRDCGTSACALGWAPVAFLEAGVISKDSITLTRLFDGESPDDVLSDLLPRTSHIYSDAGFNLLFDYSWAYIDNTALGAAARIDLYLSYTVDISDGKIPSPLVKSGIRQAYEEYIRNYENKHGIF